MGETSKEDDDWQKEYREFNNKVVVPAYRKFCDELDLPFHFWDELPEDCFDAKISLAEIQHHSEAINLFNILKPEFVLYKDQVFSFRLEDIGGAFSRHTWSINDFVEKTSNDYLYLKYLQRHFKIISIILASLTFFLIFIGTSFLLDMYSPWEFLKIKVSPLIGFIIGGITFYLLTRYVDEVPQTIIDKQGLRGITKKISKLRGELNKIRGNKPDPLRMKRQGRILLDELQKTMSTNEIQKIYHRIKTKLYVVNKDMDK